MRARDAPRSLRGRRAPRRESWLVAGGGGCTDWSWRGVGERRAGGPPGSARPAAVAVLRTHAHAQPLRRRLPRLHEARARR